MSEEDSGQKPFLQIPNFHIQEKRESVVSWDDEEENLRTSDDEEED